ncbi:uncharacterized protein LOC129718150 [Wyeomyia smithii]|uniref:uncharacterized protein LOC129718150 n=1 Tax=Wyeomyia smithii TaxID=174621 RepID=UPI002467DB86|nr:uncharacterized protein LOC129718150 [Wyeomyia smithii]
MFSSIRLYWLKGAQMVLGFVVIGLEHPRLNYDNQYNTADAILLTITLSATLVTTVILMDAFKHTIRKVFGETSWFQLELRFTGLVFLALAYSSWIVFLRAIGEHRNPAPRITVSVLGSVLSVLYLINWWQLFRERHIARDELEPDLMTVKVGNDSGCQLAANLATRPLIADEFSSTGRKSGEIPSTHGKN